MTPVLLAVISLSGIRALPSPLTHESRPALQGRASDFTEYSQADVRRHAAPVDLQSGLYRNDFVAFSEDAPDTVPWSAAQAERDHSRAPLLVSLVGRSRSVSNRTDTAVDGDVIFASKVARRTKPEVDSRKRRLRRSAGRPELSGLPSPWSGSRHLHHASTLQPVCPSVSEWVRRTDAEDFLGNRVRLAQDIDNGSARVGQYFFETYCLSSSSSSHHHQRGGGAGGDSCAGIDSTQYESVCYETHSFVYGLVSDYSRSGDGWTFVKIRSGCTCGLLDRRTGPGGGGGESRVRQQRGRGRHRR